MSKHSYFRRQREASQETNDWIGVSDLMSGLMLVFLFISVTFMLSQQKARKKLEKQKEQLLATGKMLEKQKLRLERERLAVRRIAVTFRELQNAIYRRLIVVFGKEQAKGHMTIDKGTLSISFHAPPTSSGFFFRQASCRLPWGFRKKLLWFFPRYLHILHLPKFRGQIDSVHIEGHTSSEGNYISNMSLSQCRARIVAKFLIGNGKTDKAEKKWIRQVLSVSGLSSGRVLLKRNCLGSKSKLCEDRRRSRRVTFRIKTAAEQKIVRILEALNGE